MLEFAKFFPDKLEDNRFPGMCLLFLWLAECRLSELGYLLEGEVALHYPTLKK